MNLRQCNGSDAVELALHTDWKAAAKIRDKGLKLFWPQIVECRLRELATRYRKSETLEGCSW